MMINIKTAIAIGIAIINNTDEDLFSRIDLGKRRQDFHHRRNA
jgi:hypothetical protein